MLVKVTVQFGQGQKANSHSEKQVIIYLVQKYFGS